VFSSAAVRPGPQSAPAAHIRTDRDYRTSEGRLLSSHGLASRSSLRLIAIGRVRCAAKQKSRRGIPAMAASR
jgi:hypothetical protein